MQNFRYHRTAPPKTLLEAAAWGDLVAAQTFLAKGAKPDQRDAQGWTALHHAVGYGQEPENDTLRPEQAPGYPPESGFAGGPRTA
nr:ankyrin repeat domain-containing protein [Armatimonas sp.]